MKKKFDKTRLQDLREIHNASLELWRQLRDAIVRHNKGLDDILWQAMHLARMIDEYYMRERIDALWMEFQARGDELGAETMLASAFALEDQEEYAIIRGTRAPGDSPRTTS